MPVLAISQLADKPENHPGKRPGISALCDYGAIENEAVVILFVHRDEAGSADNAAKTNAEIVIAKQRNGPRGSVKIRLRVGQVSIGY